MSAAPATRSIAFAVRAMRGTLLQPGSGDGTFAGAVTDSRTVQPRQLFFALPGERVDGFDYAAQAAAAGAAGLVVGRSRGVPAGTGGAVVIAVDDPRLALHELGRAVRAEFRGLVVGVTGSNGKTTTKELCAAALAPLGAVLRTPGNFNTDVGLPLTVLSASGNEAAWVLEMAMRARGEIALLAEIARPAIGIITNVAGAHLETLGSIEEVARAKGELFAGLGPQGIAVLPLGDRLIAEQAAPIPPARRITFGGRPADVAVLDFIPNGVTGAVVRFAVRGTPVVARLPLGGEHNARNAAAALAVASTADVAPLAAARGLESVALPPHRSAARPAGGRTILDDCYNANPASMSAALAALGAAAGAGRRFAILGDMLELGAGAAAAHRELGQAAGRELAGLAAVGQFAQPMIEEARAAGMDPRRAFAAPSPEAAAEMVAGWTSPGDWILVKASRGLRLERAVDALQSRLNSVEGPR
ncbi:MAG TPA: UDP-N-acetylmuramoyl-tripeptide--D-alanyl-D-alanine ligase [Polyangia bacterium]|nr:UDP-N-acetylmuramoyl-tripeptide--D-alanyl-D-alanine ligase [Polyangia bacterium]